MKILRILSLTLSHTLILFGICTFFGSQKVYAQLPGQWGIAVQGALSQPVGGLSDWFKPAMNYSIAAGKQYNENWFLEGLIEYGKYDEENLSGYAAGKLDLELEYYGIVINGRYRIFQISLFKPYLNLGGGIYSWTGIRGEVQADSTVLPYVPHIPENKRQETNWGFRAGIGTEILMIKSLGIDANIYYRFIVGDLFPTLQPNIELEGVSGIQSLNYSITMRYYL